MTRSLTSQHPDLSVELDAIGRRKRQRGIPNRFLSHMTSEQYLARMAALRSEVRRQRALRCQRCGCAR